jgi:NDP-hexose C3-ketoreductase / dTDP-4-oxo-2-deoxy-alpha-D-pentos-2-ene 2,3-reductase
MALRPEPYEALENERTFRAIEGFEAAAADREVDPTSLAIAWVLSNPQVTAVVVGPRRQQQLDVALAALELPLSPQEREALSRLFP